MVETIKELEQAASRLNKESDSINETLKKIQDKINSYNIGLSVWVEPPVYSQDMVSDYSHATSKRHETLFGYTKTSAGWGLAIQEREVYFDKDSILESYMWGDSQSLFKVSRETRIEALRLLPSLIEEVLRKVEGTLGNIEKAKQLAESI